MVEIVNSQFKCAFKKSQLKTKIGLSGNLPGDVVVLVLSDIDAIDRSAGFAGHPPCIGLTPRIELYIRKIKEAGTGRRNHVIPHQTVCGPQFKE
ncbi:hypothetical protein D3C72_1768590 [compost metagenome]